MKASLLLSIFTMLIILSCKNNEEKSNLKSTSFEEENVINNNASKFSENDGSGNSNEMLGEGNHAYNPSQTLYFSHAFIYEYMNGDENGEFWIYHNPDNGQLLYMPEDPMIEYVVSDTIGNYYFFGTEEFGDRVVDSQVVDWIVNSDIDEKETTYPLSNQYITINSTGKSKPLSDASKIEDELIVGNEYKWTFTKVSGSQTVYVSEQIPVNFYQVYGFNKLEGDINLPVIGFDFTGIFGKNQTVTYFKSNDLQIELVAYQFNPAFVEAGDYKFHIKTSNGDWKQERLPLLTEK